MLCCAVLLPCLQAGEALQEQQQLHQVQPQGQAPAQSAQPQELQTQMAGSTEAVAHNRAPAAEPTAGQSSPATSGSQVQAAVAGTEKGVTGQDQGQAAKEAEQTAQVSRAIKGYKAQCDVVVSHMDGLITGRWLRWLPCLGSV